MRGSRLTFPVGALLLAAIALTGCSTAAKPPHVVLVIIDTLRADKLGCYGFDRPTSPELDALAEGGVRFARVISQSPWTRPSIGSMLTSIHPRALGIYKQREGILNDGFTTLAEVLHDHGYRTIGATANPHLNRVFNFQQGFDHYVDSSIVWDWMDDSFHQTRMIEPLLPPAERLFDEAIAELDAESPAERRMPHYLQFNIMEVHENWGLDDLVRPEFKGEFPDVPAGKERRYLQAIRQVSHDLDGLVRRLGQRPGWDDVLYLFVSDHGEGLSSHPHVAESSFHGLLLYESQLVVPWIMLRTGGGLPAGRVVDRPVRMLDLVPTLLDLLGLQSPATVSGTSLVPLLADGGRVELPERFVVETLYGTANRMGVYTDRWKYFSNRDGHPGLPPEELQAVGVVEDGVVTDVAREHPDVVRELGSFLHDWELANPRIPPTLRGGELPQPVLEQLKALGYLR